MKNNNNVNICLACDDDYATYAGVVIASVLSNTCKEHDIIFYILDGGISEKHKNEILSLKYIKNCEINFIKIDETMFEEYKQVKTHWYITLATFYRLKLPSLLPNVKRVIYLDCDTVINRDLYELFSTDMGENAFAGVLDINNELIAQNPTYVNAGVLVTDLDNMRKFNLEEIFLHWTKKHIDTITCGDQEIINEVCKGKITIVDKKWNVQTSDFMNRSSFAREPYIIHYIAKNKPWKKYSLCYFKEYYLKYLQLTPWKKSKTEFFWEKYIYKILSGALFVVHRPTFMLRKKFYDALIYTYIKEKI